MHDNIKSKKLWFSVSMVALTFAYALLAATWLPGLIPLFSSFTGVLEFVVGAYLTGNVANKVVAGKFAPPKVDVIPPGGPKVD